MRSLRTRGWILVAVQMILLAVLIFVPAGDDWTVARPLQVAGLVLRILGLVAIAAGAVNLGRSLRVHPEPSPDAVLKTGGLYRYVRHPIYSGVLLLGAGIALTSGSLIAAGAAVLLFVDFSIKARLEERFLRERFEDYAAYALRTPRFFPRLRAGGSGR